MLTSKHSLLALVILSSQIGLIGSLFAQTVGPQKEDLEKARNRAVNFLKTSQLKEGGWSTTQSPGITALATYALLINGVPSNDPVIEKALNHLESYAQADGGVYAPKAYQGNYETSLALMAFQAAKQDARYQKLVKKAEQYLRGLQLDESDKLDQSDVRYGGGGIWTNG